MNEIKLEYIKSLDLNELRYELDKIHARLKQVERFKGMQVELGGNFFNNNFVNILDSDYKLLLEELEIYNYYYEIVRTNTL